MSKITNFEGDNDHVDEEYESSGERKSLLKEFRTAIVKKKIMTVAVISHSSD